MISKSELRMTKANVSNEEMAYTSKELKDMIVELVNSHIEALNKIQVAEGRLTTKYGDSYGFGSDPIIRDL